MQLALEKWLPALPVVAVSLAYAGDVALTETFSNPLYHYTIQYPSDWKCDDRGQGVVVCRNHQNKNTPALSINIQTIYTKKADGKYATVKDLMDDFRQQVPMHTRNAVFLERKPVLLKEPDGTYRDGEETVFLFRENGITYKQWQVMMLNSDGNLFQALAYRAPEKYFASYYSLAEQIFSTWSLD